MKSRWKAILGLVAIVLWALVLIIRERWQVHASEFNEVKPYVFAELPHGRIYKTVHEGCELYVAESDVAHVNDWDAHSYTITTGRGCK
jgi:hypothetical protein